MVKFTTFRSVKHTPLVGKHSKFHRTFIVWQHLTENVISQLNPGKPICRNSNGNSDPLNWANMPSYSGLENYTLQNARYQNLSPCRSIQVFGVRKRFYFLRTRFGFSPGPQKSGFKTSPDVGCRLIVKNNFRKKKAVTLLLR